MIRRFVVELQPGYLVPWQGADPGGLLGPGAYLRVDGVDFPSYIDHEESSHLQWLATFRIVEEVTDAG